MKNIIIISLFVFLFWGCATIEYNDRFYPWYKDNPFPPEAYLKDNEEPAIVGPTNLNAKFREITSHWYWCVGQTSFTGRRSSYKRIEERLVNICRKNKLKVAIWDETLADTEHGTITIPHTDYHWLHAQGQSYSFTTTSYRTYSYDIETYAYNAFFFIPIPKKIRMQYAPGFSVTNLTQKDREESKQNTGSLITVVYDKTVAFYANLFPGDIITQINDKTIYTTEDLFKVRDSSKKGDIWNVTFVRNGQLYRVTLKYDLYYSKK